VQLEPNHHEVRALFPALVDEALAEKQAVALRAHLDDCSACRAGWTSYARTVKRVREVEREKAPAELSSTILRRVRRRRWHGLRALERIQAEYRVPYEIAVPILLGAALVAFALLLLQ